MAGHVMSTWHIATIKGQTAPE